MRRVKAILIDPFACTIEHVTLDGSDIRAYYAALSHETMSVDHFTTVVPPILKHRDALFVDDEGLMKGAQRWFYMASGHQSFAGKGLIIGADSRGNAADVMTDIAIVRISTVFGEPFGERLLVTNQPWKRPDENA